MKSIFGGVGYALMGFGVASGENAYEDAIKTVLNSSPIKEELKTAGGFLVNCTGNNDSFPVLGINEVFAILNEAIHPDGNINFSATIDNSLMDDVCVTLIVTRLGELKDVPIRTQSNKWDDIGFSVIYKDKKTGELWEGYYYLDGTFEPGYRLPSVFQ